MIGTERDSCLSKLKNIDPTAKVIVSAISMVLCLCMDSIAVGWFTVVAFCALSAWKGNTAPTVFLRGMRAPFIFLLIGTITVLIHRFAPAQPILIGIPVGSWVYGISSDSLVQGMVLISRAMGCIASVYFTVLSTPIPDLLLALRRMHVPPLMLALMELIYRFIFVLYETVRHIHIAQMSRLGYQGIRRSYHSLGTLIAMVFLKAYQKSDKIYTALESRGYEGEFCTLPPLYKSGHAVYYWYGCICFVQIGAFLLERGFL